MSDQPPVPPGATPAGSLPAAYPGAPPLGPPPPPVPPGALPPRPPWTLGDATPPPEPRRPVPGWVIGLAVLAVFGLVAGVVALVVGDDGETLADRSPVSTEAADDPTTTTGDPSGPPTTIGTPTTTTAPPVSPEELQAAVDEIEAFVAAQRGLPFQREVTVELAAEGEFQSRLLADFDENAADIEAFGFTMEALGLVPPGTDLAETLRSLLGIGVVGFYDPETDELVVRGTALTPYVRTVIAHELTHALDDQWFELNRPQLDDTGDEQGYGFTALVEGSASVVEEAYRDSLTEEEQASAAEEEQALGTDPGLLSIPLPLIESLQSPYVLGPELIDAIADAGGQPRLDAAFGTPPTTSEQILEPDLYLAGEGAVAIEAPAADGDVVDDGVLGALGLAQVLGVGPLLNPFGDQTPVEGWGGDRYVTWLDDDGSPCVRAAFVGDTATDSDEIADALQDFADDPPSPGIEATVEIAASGAPVVLTSCSRSGGVAPPSGT